ncbi:Helix-turn-helix domain protein [Roseimaritima multifibrata]|uniref:Helix-turn-helix domain protein n=1 Tax=Roseimaritima multifibrata TaxID=1930274 RepID=A0A517MJ17_9BACT|nr:helix-turn-helix domain-containing protein [Roseimaritima multifibrata]QDS94891.1 Helix-turn-helix domain protein [Roseimaritima multifibrata]
MSISSPLLLSVADAAKMLATSERSLFRLTAPRGPIPPIRIGRSVRYSVDDLQAYVDSRRSAATRTQQVAEQTGLMVGTEMQEGR